MSSLKNFLLQGVCAVTLLFGLPSSVKAETLDFDIEQVSFLDDENVTIEPASSIDFQFDVGYPYYDYYYPYYYYDYYYPYYYYPYYYNYYPYWRGNYWGGNYWRGNYWGGHGWRGGHGGHWGGHGGHWGGHGGGHHGGRGH